MIRKKIAQRRAVGEVPDGVREATVGLLSIQPVAGVAGTARGREPIPAADGVDVEVSVALDIEDREAPALHWADETVA